MKRGEWVLKASMAASTDGADHSVISGLASHSHSWPRRAFSIGSARGSVTSPPARLIGAASFHQGSRSKSPTWWSLGLVPRRSAARRNPASTASTLGPETSPTTTAVLRVLQTFRSSEWYTTSSTYAGSASGATTIHAPPVPWRLTGVPAWRATAPNWATAGPDPRATATASRRSENIAQPADRSGESTSDTAPSRRPAAAIAGSRACSAIARAVPRASEPIRNTTVFLERSTPVASANTLGRPSNTNPDRKSTRLNSSHVRISYAVFCLKKKKTYQRTTSELHSDHH